MYNTKNLIDRIAEAVSNCVKYGKSAFPKLILLHKLYNYINKGQSNFTFFIYLFKKNDDANNEKL